MLGRITELQSADFKDRVMSMIDRCCEAASRALLSGASADADERRRIDVSLRTLYYMNQLIDTARATAMVSTTSDDVDDDTLAAGIARFSKLDVDDANNLQQLLLYLLNCAELRGYRRFNGECYRRITTPDGHDSCAWERACSLTEFIFDVTRKELNYNMWRNLTSNRTNMSSTIDYLSNCSDVQFPPLKRDRHAFSFRNGVYFADTNEFVRFRSNVRPTRSVATAKYFDLEFDGGHVGLEDWFNIPTPHLQSILDYQGMAADVSRWMYVFIGRLLYTVNERDTWQVIPFLKGVASSGKSTILNRVCRGLYDWGDVGVLSNNIERKFGISALSDKFLFIGPEIKSDIALEQAEFQSIVSGETLQVAVKYQTAKSVEWTVPGILAGNEVPAWVDNAGSINRRIVLFEFPRRVDDGDMELGKKLDAEMAAILVKSNRAYLDAVRRFAKENVWKHLPAAFHSAKEDFTADVNSLVHFLRSGQLEFGDDRMYVPMEDFTTAYQFYVKQLGLPKMRLVGDALKQPLMSFNCRVKKETRKWPRDGSNVRYGTYVIGLSIRDRGGWGVGGYIGGGDGDGDDPLNG